MRTFGFSAVLAVVVAGALAGCSPGGPRPSTSGGERTVRVVAAENFWGNIVAQIGGTHVQVTSIISDPSADPHEYESNVKDAAAIARADLVLTNGLGYDDFMGKLLSASPRSGRTQLVAAKIMGISGDNANPHIWYDTAQLPVVSGAIVSALGRLDPADAAQFSANGKAFVASLGPILAVLAELKARYHDAPIAYTERVPGYLVSAAGLRLATPSSFAQAIEDGSDPSPADTAAFDRAISNHEVRVLFYNAQVTDPQTDKIKKLATDSGVPVIGVTETLPSTDKDFQAWQLRQDTALLRALGG